MSDLDENGLSSAIDWFNDNFNGMPDAVSLVTGVIRAYVAAVGEPVYSTTLFTVIADIREKTGVGQRPMLSELADAVAARCVQAPAPEGPIPICRKCIMHRRHRTSRRSGSPSPPLQRKGEP